MLTIQVLGTGVIPRGLGLAPRREPFKADLSLIQVILSSPCKFKVNMVNPESGRFVEVTNKNLKSLWDKYSNYKPTPVETPEVNEQEDETPEEPKKEDDKDEVHINNSSDDKTEDEFSNDDEDIIAVKTPEEEVKEETTSDDSDEVAVHVASEETNNTQNIPKNVLSNNYNKNQNNGKNKNKKH